MNWMPIETAPDNTRVILWIADKSFTGCVFGKVRKYGPNDIDFFPEGFGGRWNCTHWMPIPEEPKP